MRPVAYLVVHNRMMGAEEIVKDTSLDLVIQYGIDVQAIEQEL